MEPEGSLEQSQMFRYYWLLLRGRVITDVWFYFSQWLIIATCFCFVYKGWKVKWSHYRPGVAQRMGRGIALLFHDRGTRRGWVISGTPRSHFAPRKDPVPIWQEAGCAPGPVWTGENSRPHRDSIPGCPARSSVTILTELPGLRTRGKRVNYFIFISHYVLGIV